MRPALAPRRPARRAPGSRSGSTRDLAWGDLVCRVRHGILLAVDYGHTRGDRPTGGTLTAYRAGALVAPVPDGSCDLTAHVAVDSLDHDELTTQRAALRATRGHARPPPTTTWRAPTRPATSPPWRAPRRRRADRPGRPRRLRVGAAPRARRM